MRALGRAGYDVGATGGPDGRLAGWSRFCRRFHLLPLDAPGVEGRLRAVVEEGGYDVVVAASDPAVAAVAAAGLSVPSVPAPGEPLERLLDKQRLPGAPAPPFPAVVKAARSAAMTTDGVVHAPGAVVVRDAADAERAAAAIPAALGALVQPRIAVSDKLHAVVLRRGGASSLRFAARVLRERPRTGGFAVAAEALDPDGRDAAEALAALERVCDAAGYEGLAMAEVLRDGDGRWWVVDVNPRPWGGTGFAEALGVDVSRRAVEDALGLPPRPPPSYRAGARYHSPLGELRRLREEPSSAPAVVRSLGRRDVYEWLSPTDPWPVVRAVMAGRRTSRPAPR